MTRDQQPVGFSNRKKIRFLDGDCHHVAVADSGTRRIPFNSWENDTIFKARPDGSYEPAFTWIIGKYKIPFSGIRDYARYLREKQNYILDFHACEGFSA